MPLRGRRSDKSHRDLSRAPTGRRWPGKGRTRPALTNPGGPQDHHHQYLADVLPGYGVATKSHPCALVAFVAVQATQPLRPAGPAPFAAVRVVIKGWKGTGPYCRTNEMLFVSSDPEASAQSLATCSEVHVL